MPEEATYDVVIHGIPLEEDLALLQQQLDFDRSKGASLIRVERLTNKKGELSLALKLTFSGSCPLSVHLKEGETTFRYRTEAYAKPLILFRITNTCIYCISSWVSFLKY